MGEVNKNEEEEDFPTLKIPFLPLQPPSSMMHYYSSSSGTETPPLRTLASVPFQWEEQPGKPRPCTDIILSSKTNFNHQLQLQLPPCRITKTPSPTTVLDGPSNMGRPKFSSFRFFKEAHHDSYESSSPTDSICSFSPDGLLIKKNGGHKGKGCFSHFSGGSFRFSSSSSSSENFTTNVKNGEKVKRKGSFSHDGKSTHIWVAIYEGLKQAIPWKSSKKLKKEVVDV